MSVQVVLPGVLADLAGGARRLGLDLATGPAATGPGGTGPGGTAGAGTGATGSAGAGTGAAGTAGLGTLAALLDALALAHPVLVRRLRDETGALRRYVNVYVDGIDVRGQHGLATPVADGAVVQVLPATAGG